MYCLYCTVGELRKGTLILDAGLKLRVYYCPHCERIQRIGTSVPDVGDNYKNSYIRKFKKP